MQTCGRPSAEFLVKPGTDVPTIVVDSPARIAEAFPIVDELTAEHGMVTSETVPAMVSIDGADRVGGTGLAFFGH